MEYKIFLKDDKDTEILGGSIAEVVGKKIVIALKGELGAGKTSITKAIVKKLGIKDDVTSPTFNIMNIYQNDEVSVYHFDFYRLRSENELENIGFYDYSNMGVCIIEWADKFIKCLAKNYILLELTYSEDNKSRYAKIEQIGKGEDEKAGKIYEKFMIEKGVNI